MSNKPSVPALRLSVRLPLGASEKRLRREPGVSLAAGAHPNPAGRGECAQTCEWRLGAAPAADVTVFVAQRVEEELYSSSSQLKKQSEAGAEPFLYDTHSNLQRAAIPRQHHHLMREPSTPTGQTRWLFGVPTTRI